jgi:leucyl aminopeptidase
VPPKISIDRAEVTYPKEVTRDESALNLIDQLDKTKIRANLMKFSNFNNRYYQSHTGNQSAEWLLAKAQGYVSDNASVFVSVWYHGYRQSSVGAIIPGKSNKRIVVGAHQDSINVANGVDPMTSRAPGAGSSHPISVPEFSAHFTDDNGLGSMTILEAFRVLLLNDTIVHGMAEHTIEFHWYAAEEVSLIGSGPYTERAGCGISYSTLSEA